MAIPKQFWENILLHLIFNRYFEHYLQHVRNHL